MLKGEDMNGALMPFARLSVMPVLGEDKWRLTLWIPGLDEGEDYGYTVYATQERPGGREEYVRLRDEPLFDKDPEKDIEGYWEQGCLHRENWHYQIFKMEMGDQTLLLTDQDMKNWEKYILEMEPDKEDDEAFWKEWSSKKAWLNMEGWAHVYLIHCIKKWEAVNQFADFRHSDKLYSE